MIRSRFGLLGLCAVVFGVMAFGAAAAHAEVGAQWLLAELFKDANGEVLVKLIPFLPATVELKKETTGILHSKISGTEVLFECEEIKAINAKLLPNGSIGEKEGAVSGSKVRFSGCKTKLKGVESKPCEPNAGGTEPGVINTSSGHGLIVLHILKNEKGEEIGKDELVKILPDSGETFATIEMGKECSIGTKVPVIGEAFLKDCLKQFLEHKLEHLVEVDGTVKEGGTGLTKLWVISKTTEHEATILGSAWAFLGGVHKGLHFSGDPA